jgi:hypothetical protein
MNNSRKIQLLSNRIVALENNLNRQSRQINSMQQTIQQMLLYLPINNENYYRSEITKIINDVLIGRDINSNVDDDDDDTTITADNDASVSADDDDTTISNYKNGEDEDDEEEEEDDISFSDFTPKIFELSDGECEDDNISEHSSMPELIEILDDDEDEADDISFSDFTPKIIELSDAEDDISEHSSMPELIEIDDDEEEDDDTVVSSSDEKEVDYAKIREELLNFQTIFRNMGIWNMYASSNSLDEQ